MGGFERRRFVAPYSLGNHFMSGETGSEIRSSDISISESELLSALAGSFHPKYLVRFRRAISQPRKRSHCVKEVRGSTPSKCTKVLSGPTAAGRHGAIVVPVVERPTTPPFLDSKQEFESLREDRLNKNKRGK